MRLDVQKYNQIAVLSLQGEFTHEAVKAFEDAASSLLAESEITGIVLDMSKVVFFDSAAIEALLEFNDRCRDRLRQLKLAGLDDICRKIFEITRLLGQFDTYDELSEAVKSFA
jgi:anti-anti-sigma factor